ncbi:hypothetical protein CJ030_MR1G002327 [Morella rubra]|uniref:Uncharacterized protein n=1 Tax=Morella rubra TaxID=262757 RepID=A0A6A1WLM5_9ROSI|nr:hypothetical protein CJ030_MR1G002327 [Morella rubra]
MGTYARALSHHYIRTEGKLPLGNSMMSTKPSVYKMLKRQKRIFAIFSGRDIRPFRETFTSIL